MGRRLIAALAGTLLALSSTACGGDSESDDSSAQDSTSQSESSTESGQSDDAGDDTQQPLKGDDKDKADSDDEKSGKKKKGALPDDLPSEDSADPNDLPIDVKVLMRTCEDVDPKDSWPSADDIYFDAGADNVVLTADVDVNGETVKMICDVSGTNQSASVNAYNPI